MSCCGKENATFLQGPLALMDPPMCASCFTFPNTPKLVWDLEVTVSWLKQHSAFTTKEPHDSIPQKRMDDRTRSVYLSWEAQLWQSDKIILFQYYFNITITCENNRESHSCPKSHIRRRKPHYLQKYLYMKWKSGQVPSNKYNKS